jgi:hypothetical protein
MKGFCCYEVIEKPGFAQSNQHTHLSPLHLVVSVGPFAKWGIGFTICNPPSAADHNYIIMDVDYFTKWAEVRPTYSSDAKTVTLFLFNQNDYFQPINELKMSESYGSLSRGSIFPQH